jgi:hypothetical protein
MDASGLIGSAAQTGTAALRPEGRTHAYLIHDATAEGGPRITVTQGDIRAIQLAKSALYAGARLLMDEMRRRPGRPRGAGRGLRRAYLAQARDGAGHDPRRAAGQGDLGRQRRRAPARASRCATARAGRDRARVRQITKVETAIEPRFQEHFVAANAIPHKTDPFPLLRIPSCLAEALGVGPGLIEALLEDAETAPVAPELRPLLRYVAKLNTLPSRLGQADADAVFAAGWDEAALFHAIQVSAAFNLFNRLVEGAGVDFNYSGQEDSLTEADRIADYAGFACRIGAEPH